jgi:hypothetical protein
VVLRIECLQSISNQGIAINQIIKTTLITVATSETPILRGSGPSGTALFLCRNITRRPAQTLCSFPTLVKIYPLFAGKFKRYVTFAPAPATMTMPNNYLICLF